MKLQLLYLVIVVGLMQTELTYADHSTPERIVDNKYVVILVLNENNQTMDLRFYFRYISSGKNIEDPIEGILRIQDDETKLFLVENISLGVDRGIGKFSYTFPTNGLYKIHLEFKKTNETNLYVVEPWAVWVPGTEKTRSYPIGLTEITGFGLLIFAVVFALLNFRWIKNKKKK